MVQRMAYAKRERDEQKEVQNADDAEAPFIEIDAMLAELERGIGEMTCEREAEDDGQERQRPALDALSFWELSFGPSDPDAEPKEPKQLPAKRIEGAAMAHIGIESGKVTTLKLRDPALEPKLSG